MPETATTTPETGPDFEKDRTLGDGGPVVLDPETGAVIAGGPAPRARDVEPPVIFHDPTEIGRTPEQGPVQPGPHADALAAQHDEEDVDLEDHTVAELREIADSEGVDVPSGARKADIVDAIEEHRGE